MGAKCQERRGKVEDNQTAATKKGKGRRRRKASSNKADFRVYYNESSETIARRRIWILRF